MTECPSFNVLFFLCFFFFSKAQYCHLWKNVFLWFLNYFQLSWWYPVEWVKAHLIFLFCKKRRFLINKIIASIVHLPFLFHSYWPKHGCCRLVYIYIKKRKKIEETLISFKLSCFFFFNVDFIVANIFPQNCKDYFSIQKEKSFKGKDGAIIFQSTYF